MNYAIIENNKITNVVVTDSPLSSNWIKLQDGFSIGDEYSNGVFSKPIKQLAELKKEKISNITIKPTEPVTINTVTYNGGNSSASAINGAVTLAQALAETDVKLWDIDNNVATYTFEEAQNITAQIAKEYRDKQLAKYTLIEKIKACTTVKELEAIKV